MTDTARIREALETAKALTGVPGHYSDALSVLRSYRIAKTTWYDAENALRREVDAYLDTNGWQREAKS